MSPGSADDARELDKKFAETEASDGPPVEVITRPWIPPGKYEFEFAGHECLVMRWGPKLLCHFRVIDGEHRGIELKYVLV